MIVLLMVESGKRKCKDTQYFRYSVVNVCMKVKYLRLKSWLIATLMGALGLSSCESHRQAATPKEDPEPAVRGREEMRLMYGVPTMNYMIRGQVKDAQGKPVKDIRVNMLERGMEATADTLYGDPERVKEWLEESAAVTDKKGRFELTGRGTPQEQVRLMVRDVDGRKNGEYKNQLLEVKVEEGDVDRTEAGGWYQGTFRKDLDVRMEKKD